MEGIEIRLKKKIRIVLIRKWRMIIVVLCFIRNEKDKIKYLRKIN